MSLRFSSLGVSFPIPRLDGVIAADATSSKVPQSEGQGIWGMAFHSQPILRPPAPGILAGKWYSAIPSSWPCSLPSWLSIYPDLESFTEGLSSCPSPSPDPPVKGPGLPALRLMNLYGWGTEMGRCSAGQGFPRNRTNSGRASGERVILRNWLTSL